MAERSYKTEEEEEEEEFDEMVSFLYAKYV
jgi:hypothetical protein